MHSSKNFLFVCSVGFGFDSFIQRNKQKNSHYHKSDKREQVCHERILWCQSSRRHCKGVRLVDPQRSPPTSASLWFCIRGQTPRELSQSRQKAHQNSHLQCNPPCAAIARVFFFRKYMSYMLLSTIREFPLHLLCLTELNRSFQFGKLQAWEGTLFIFCFASVPTTSSQKFKINKLIN